MRFAFTVAYHGKNFSGFQIQHGRRTVQAELERALSIVFRQKLRIHTAGRTDAGVHAFGQVVHTEVELSRYTEKQGDLQTETFLYSVNSILDKDVVVTHMAQVPEQFHARFSCTGREYVYQVLQFPVFLPHYRDVALWVRGPLDIAAMREAASHLIGELDFAAFTPAFYRKAGEKTIRRIDKIEIIENRALLWFYFDGSGFLHNMIRIITGTLLAVGRGELTALQVKEILVNRSREAAGMTIPPTGLFFLNARYAEYETPGKKNPFREELLSLTR